MSVLNQIQQTNVSAPAIYTEYSVAIPPGAMDVSIYLRPVASPASLYYYTAPSGSVSPGSAANLPATYGTLPPGAAKTFNGKFGGQTLYFQVDATNQVLELDYHADN